MCVFVCFGMILIARSIFSLFQSSFFFCGLGCGRTSPPLRVKNRLWRVVQDVQEPYISSNRHSTGSPRVSSESRIDQLLVRVPQPCRRDRAPT